MWMYVKGEDRCVFVYDVRTLGLSQVMVQRQNQLSLSLSFLRFLATG